MFTSFSSRSRELEELRNQANCTNLPHDQREALEAVSFYKRRDANQLSMILERLKYIRQRNNNFYALTWIHAFNELNDHNDQIVESMYRDLGKHLDLSADTDRSDDAEIVTLLHAMYDGVQRSYTTNFLAVTYIVTHLFNIIKTHPNPLSILKAYKILYTDNFIAHGYGKMIDTSLHEAVELFFPEKYSDEPESSAWIKISDSSDPYIIIQAIHESEDKINTARMLADSDDPIKTAKDLLTVKYSLTACRP